MILKKRNIKVCFTPEQFNKQNFNKSSIVVVVDILRATSVISTAFENGIKSVIPVLSAEEALLYKNKYNHIIAGERNTVMIEGFDYGNSPFQYMNSDINGKSLVLTTTNGTKAINIASNHKVITASFLNITAVTDYLLKCDSDIIILCSAWKSVFNLEDSIFAGALSQSLLKHQFFGICDSMIASINLYNFSKNNLFEYLSTSEYRNRNSSKNLIRDTKFCLEPNLRSNIVPILDNGKLVRA